MKYLFTIMCTVLMVTTAIAQSNDNDSTKVFFLKRYYVKMQAKAAANAKKFETYRVSGYGIGQASVQDTRMALPVYTGLSFGTNLSWREFSEKWYNEVSLEFAYTNPSFENGGFGSYNNFRMFSNISYLRRLGSESNWFLGGGIHFVDGLRLYNYLGNSSVNNDLIISLNPELRYQTDFTFLKRKFNAYSGISVNGFSYVNRLPSFAIALNGSTDYWAPIGQFNRVRMATGLHWLKKFSDENRMGLEYSWDFYALNENDGYVKLRSAQHLFSLNFWFKTR